MGDASTVRSELGKVLSSPVFAGSPRMSRFLTFIVEETLAGNSDGIKEYAIAIEVFDKRPDYDPRTDSTVRTEAGKLRARLSRYYQTEGRGDTLVISIPKGKYVPVFNGKTQENGRTLETRAPLSKAVWISTAAAFAVLLAILSFRAAGMRNPPAPRTVPLTTFAGNQGHPSFSPDGNQVAFVWDGNNNWDIYVKMIGSVTAHRLTTDPAWHNFPAWSPDGRQIAFLKFVPGAPSRGVVYTISPLGGPEREVASFDAANTKPAWSPDGRFLLVAKSFDELKPEPGSGGLFIIPAQGGDARRLLIPPPGQWYLSPAVSPSGHSLAFTSCRGTVSAPMCDVSVAKLNADLLPEGEPRQITRVGVPFAGLTWTADSRSIIYSTCPGGDQAAKDIYLWRIDASVGAIPQRLEIASAGAFSPAVAPHGNRLAFTRMVADTDIWRVDLGKPARPLLVSTMADQNPLFSPDGRRIAFASARGMDGNQIWLSNSDGSAVVQLTSGTDDSEGSPRWSPDGRWIAFDVSTKDGARMVKIVDVSNGRVRQLTPNSSKSSVPSWSHDGKWVYFRSDRGGRSEIWRMPPDGGTAEQVTHNGGYVALDSDDSKTVYYTKTGADGPLFRKLLDRASEEQVLPRIVSRGFAVFDDGIYYLDDADRKPGLRRHYEIRFYQFASGDSRTVIGGIDGYHPGLGLSVSPDRKGFLLTLWGSIGDNLMLIENFR
jgi:Tol biopolymer transport system component